MRLKSQAILLAGVALCMASCSDDNPWIGEDGKGGISLHLGTSADVVEAKPKLVQSTRATGSVDAPTADLFSVRLEKPGDAYSKTWANLAAFTAEEGFPTGNYTLTAFYGNPDEEGFELPYFEGTTNLTVLEARETDVEVTASLANCMVSVDYTDAFKKYFSEYATTVHSVGHTYVEIPRGETRPAFVNPGEIDLTVEFTKPNGKSAKVQPASFMAEARHHYHITFDVNNGQVGEAQLSIVFDDSIVQEDVYIDLTDELFSTAAPAVKPSGFTSGQTIELLSETAPENPLKFTVIAHGGLQEANLTIASSAWNPAFGHEINLIAASEAQQAQIADCGIRVLGLYKNPDKMASVDITGLLAHLPAGDYDISLMAKDRYTRVSDPVTIHITTVALDMDITPQIGVFGVPKATFNVSYNGADPAKDITFKAMDRNGAFVDCAVESVQDATRTRSITKKDYIITVALPDADRDAIKMEVYLKGRKVAEPVVKIVQPEYSIAADAFANQAILKVNSDDADTSVGTIAQALNVYVNGNQVSKSNLSYNTASGLVFIKNLTPATTYNITATLSSQIDSNAKEVTVTTEAETDVPNGDFSAVNSGSITHNDVEVGGKYAYSVAYQLTANILRDEPKEWANINGRTCWWGGSNTKNTWFQVPSTYAENGAVVLRNVAYDINGTKPAGAATGLGKTTWYCPNVPTFTTRAAGELFLGSFSFNGSADSRSEGLAFASRPKSLSFDYTYVPTGSDLGYVSIEVVDASGKTIASATNTLAAASNMKSVTLTLSNYAFGSRAASLRVKFLSSNGAAPTVTPTGSDLHESNSKGKIGAANFGNLNIGTNNYKAVSTGSVLTIDNVKLHY